VNNFNTALSIISGLNSSAVHRLKFTRAEVPDRLWAVRSPFPPPKASALLGLMIQPIHGAGAGTGPTDPGRIELQQLPGAPPLRQPAGPALLVRPRLS